MSTPHSSPDHLGDELVGLLLGEGDEQTLRSAESHVAACAPCREDLMSLATVRRLVAGASPQTRPSEALWVAIRAAIDPAREASSQRLEVAQPTGWHRLPYRMAAAAAAAVMVATAALGGWWVGHETGGNPAPELAGVATDDLVFTLAPLNTDGRASGRIFMSDDRTRGMVVVAGLPQLIPGRVYGVWLVTNDQQRVSAGRFVVDERGASLTSLTLP
ncbi:MAG: anti-sigma factor, partial [Dehalococcoidia bacterium]|nr:anti-sigma factor [Dehalococcoidia bacterium]